MFAWGIECPLLWSIPSILFTPKTVLFYTIHTIKSLLFIYCIKRSVNTLNSITHHSLEEFLQYCLCFKYMSVHLSFKRLRWVSRLVYFVDISRIVLSGLVLIYRTDA
ncbi:hypothetical protein BDF14DRAFT_1830106 [Spinellus fusiger]|nr:hypothetical protein BDF14DRAFT_1830106 [Spinellus fusiger]